MERETPEGTRTKKKLLEQTAQTLIAALLLGSASGCATMDYDDAYARPPMYNARPSARPVKVVQVLPGDTVDSVATRFNVSAEAIIETNGLHEPYILHRGQSLVLPPSSVHVVASGETINSIARSYGVSAVAIIDVNNLHEPNALYPGERLTIPYVGARQAARVERVLAPVVRSELAAPTRTTAPTTVVMADDPRLAGARYYTAPLPRAKPVPSGMGGPEYSSARQAKADDAETHIARPAKPRAVKADDAADEAYEAPRPSKPRPSKAEDSADEAYDAPRPAKPRQVASIDPSDEAYDGSAHRGKPETPTAPVKASSHFVWPVRGQIISGFGKRANGVHNDGINIAAEPGSSVKAADNGVVVYAGNELAGYGNLLLIRHSNGYVTAYAHNKKLLVGKGDSVRQGQTIALVGSTGDVDRPQLHFEIRKGDRAVDPGRFLESANASL